VPSPKSWARLYCNVSLIDCESKEVLDELLATLSLDRFVLRRLSDRTIIVDGQHKPPLARALARRGRPFRIVDLPAAFPSNWRDGS
jgi:hypothetical protein